VRVGEGKSRRALTARLPQPPHPHDLHWEGSPRDGGGEGLAVLWTLHQLGNLGPASTIVHRPALTSTLHTG
jgi:hypothetical protein